MSSLSSLVPYLSSLAVFFCYCHLGAADEPLHLNQIQVIGSHNSYKEAIDAPLITLIQERTGQSLAGLDYAHLTLTDQLNLGLRGLELDVYNDPDGGRYASPLGIKWLKENGVDPPPYDPDGVMRKPGFKVLHVADIDFRSHNLTLQNALDELRMWSTKNPRHLPVVGTMNLKDGQLSFPGAVAAAAWDASALDALDEAMRHGLGNDRILTPDDVRGANATLEDAVLRRGWPTLEATRGHFLFVMDESGKKPRLFLADYDSLRGRTLFTTSPPGNPDAAVQVVNDPIVDHNKIKDLVAKGYLVRTRADADTVEARSGDLSRFSAAKSSGAQVISTDYYIADWRLQPRYFVRFDDSRCVRLNPVTTSAQATLKQLED